MSFGGGAEWGVQDIEERVVGRPLEEVVSRQVVHAVDGALPEEDGNADEQRLGDSLAAPCYWGGRQPVGGCPIGVSYWYLVPPLSLKGEGYFLISHVRKQRLRDVAQLACGHTANQ